MPIETTSKAAKTPSRLDHIINVAVILLLLADMWMVGTLMEKDYDKFLTWKTSTIKGDGPMAPKEAFWYWVDNWLVEWLMMIVPSNLALAFVHVPRIFKKPSLLNEVMLAIEGFALVNIFIFVVSAYWSH